MDFPKEFFEGEEREGFYIAPMMKKAWAAQIEVMEDIRALCKKHNIKFFADYGTLLGAIRHKGFIPWDDDMDLAMIRVDYNKFLEVAHELPPNYKIINFHTEPAFTQMLTRVVNNDRVCFEPEFLEKYHGCPYAVGVDIFIQDYMSPDPEEDEMICELIEIVFGQAGVIDTDDIEPDDKEMLIGQIEELCNVKIDRSRAIRPQLFALGESLCSMYSEEEATEITSMIKHVNNRSHNIKKANGEFPPEVPFIPDYRMDKACYASSIEMAFEITTIPVPVGYETVLRLKYGENYMTPVNCKAGHDYPFYKYQEQVVKEKFGFIPE